MLPQLIAALLTVGAAPAPTAGAAPASIDYDISAKTGYVGAADVRAAYGWTVPTLGARAGGLVFNHDFWTDDTYAVSCGGPAFRVVHHREFGRYEIADKPSYQRVGYGRKLLGFRLTGPVAGISGTSVRPGRGQPCPAEGAGTTITSTRLVSTAKGCALSVTSRDVRRELLVC
jgi:hypothetical protein